jgi:hypothetical protein
MRAWAGSQAGDEAGQATTVSLPWRNVTALADDSVVAVRQAHE